MSYNMSGYHPVIPAAARISRRLRGERARTQLLRRAERIDREIDHLARQSAHLIGFSERLVAAARAVRRLLHETLEEVGLSPGQEVLMMRLLEEPNCRMEDHARRLDVSPQTLSRSARRLEAAGMVVRMRHPTDPRTMQLVLTDSGAGSARNCAEVLAHTDEELLAGRSVDEVHSLTEWLTTVHIRANGLLHQDRRSHITR